VDINGKGATAESIPECYTKAPCNYRGGFGYTNVDKFLELELTTSAHLREKYN
jgi:hypothetical protein